MIRDIIDGFFGLVFIFGIFFLISIIGSGGSYTDNKQETIYYR